MGGHFTKEKMLKRHMLTDRTVQLVCHAYLADYCCFNFPWPEPCQALILSQQQATPSAPRIDAATGVSLQLSCRSGPPPRDSASCSGGNTCSNGGVIVNSNDDISATSSEDNLESPVLWRDEPIHDQPRNPPHVYAAEKNVLMLQAAYAKDAAEKFATLR